MVGGIGILGRNPLALGLPSIQSGSMRALQKLQQKTESGALDPAQLQERLLTRFGEAARGIVGENGAIDTDALKSLLHEARGERAQGDGPLHSPLGKGFVEHLQAMLESGAISTDEIQDRLSDRFGEIAKGVITEDGSIDISKIEGLVAQHRAVPHPTGPMALVKQILESVRKDDGSIDADALRDLTEKTAHSIYSSSGALQPQPVLGGGQNALFELHA